MDKNNIPKFKKNESFYIRDGWFEKAINTIEKNKDINIFSKNNGQMYLGIGSNMVKGLKYWLKASNIIDCSQSKTTLSRFGQLIFKYDRYLETEFSWFLIHYYLCVNFLDCPIFYIFFNSNFKSITKNDLLEYISGEMALKEYSIKKMYIDDDTNIFLKSYMVDGRITNPEDNYICPLSNLKLMNRNGDRIEKIKPSTKDLSPLIIYLSLFLLFDGNSFNIEDSYDCDRSPTKIFNLDKNLYLQYLYELKKEGHLDIVKTAGLNVVYFKAKFTLEEIFAIQFKE